MTKNSFQKNQVVVYQAKSGAIELCRDADKETIWATQAQIADVFEIDRSVVTKHIGNVLRSREVKEKSNVQKMHIRNSDKPVAFYSLDMILAVGYRANSAKAMMFRKWATKTLRAHIIDGYTINENRLRRQAQKIEDLKEAVRLLGNIALLSDVSVEMKGIVRIIEEYSRALDILDDYDHQRLIAPKGIRRELYVLTYEEAVKIITVMKNRFNGSSMVGQERDASFKSSLGAVYQTFGGKDVYVSVEEKAAYLLYFVTKNHSFVDGNKRIAAALFVCFLQKNRLLLRKDGSKRIDNAALAALTLMAASSKPSEKDMMIKVILNLLK